MDSRALLRPIVAIFVTLSFAMLMTGCDKDDDTTTGTVTITVPANLYPLTAGRRIMYNGYLTLVDANGNDTETEFMGSSNGFYSSWTVTNITHPTTGMTVLIDTTRALGGTTVQNLLGDFTASNGQYGFVTELGFFLRTFGITGVDSTAKIVLAKTGIAVGQSFESFNQTYTGNVGGTAAPVNLTVTGKWEAKQTVTINGVSYETYYLVVSRTISVAGSPVAGGITAKAWFTPDIGPVRLFLAGDAEGPGKFMEITGKNF